MAPPAKDNAAAKPPHEAHRFSGAPRIARLTGSAERAIILDHVWFQQKKRGGWVMHAMPNWRWLLSWMSERSLWKHLAWLVDNGWLQRNGAPGVRNEWLLTDKAEIELTATPEESSVGSKPTPDVSSGGPEESSGKTPEETSRAPLKNGHATPEETSGQSRNQEGIQPGFKAQKKDVCNGVADTHVSFLGIPIEEIWRFLQHFSSDELKLDRVNRRRLSTVIRENSLELVLNGVSALLDSRIGWDDGCKASTKSPLSTFLKERNTERYLAIARGKDFKMQRGVRQFLVLHGLATDAASEANGRLPSPPEEPALPPASKDESDAEFEAVGLGHLTTSTFRNVNGDGRKKSRSKSNSHPMSLAANRPAASRDVGRSSPIGRRRPQATGDAEP